MRIRKIEKTTRGKTLMKAMAGKCFAKYRRAGVIKRAPLPDFYIGAHAAVKGWHILTRDTVRYQTYFPRLEVISP